jgi:hypothetical protein
MGFMPDLLVWSETLAAKDCRPAFRRDPGKDKADVRQPLVYGSNPQA